MARHDLGRGDGFLKSHVFPHGPIARVLCACALAALPALAHAGQITISWDPDPQTIAAGYRILNAPAGEPFSTPIEVGSATALTLTGLDAGLAYHAAVVAYDELGQESPLSVEVVYNPKEEGGAEGDADQDGLADALEAVGCTSPTDADTDDDGLLDGAEDLNGNGLVDAGETDACVADNPLLFADTFADGGKNGDPSWKRVLGSWSVVGTARRYASAKSGVSMALAADPKIRDFSSGRIETWLSLTRAFTVAPEARILFHYQDAAHYRYLRCTENSISLGQVGSTFADSAGVKATLLRRLTPNTGQRVRIDIENGADVKIYLNGGPAPVFSYRFAASGTGRVGFRTEGARSLFDNTAVWSDFVLR